MGIMSENTLIVVPCYNESQRLNGAEFLAALEHRPWLRFLFVDDGSTDQTRDVLEQLRAKSPQKITVLALPQNGGKGEAVRRGMLRGFEYDVGAIGYWDADLATKFDQLDEMLALLLRSDADAVFGARVQLLGRDIQRNFVRHLLGRGFATAASLVLGLRIYDTQCGAKLFVNHSDIAQHFQAPFVSRWSFDVELISRMTTAGAPPAREKSTLKIIEFPLHRWADIGGSKLQPHDFARAGLDLTRVWYRQRNARRQSRSRRDE